MKGERVWKGVVWALAVWAVAASLNTVLSYRRHRDVLAPKVADLEKILRHAGRWQAEDAWRARMDAKQAWVPADLDEWATRTLGAGVARIDLRSAASAADGWQVREAAVELGNVSYAEAAAFLAAAGSASPPWRLREISIQPGAEAGAGTMNLALEALEKDQP
ncbi:MAG: hypothetical protein AB7V14_09910 [Kiritimatiellia bacterium]